MSKTTKRKQLDLFNQPAPTAPYLVVEKRQYCNGKWDEQYCLRHYRNPDIYPQLSDCKQVFKTFQLAKDYAHQNKLEIRLNPYQK